MLGYVKTVRKAQHTWDPRSTSSMEEGREEKRGAKEKSVKAKSGLAV